MAGETRLEEYLKLVCEMEGVFVRKVTAIGNTGFPDRLLAFNGKIYLVELKNPNKRGALSPKQMQTADELAAVGIDVMVISSKNEVIDALSKIINA